ncbi:MAG: ribonuclease P protein component [Halioglobus sp.]
MQRHAVGSTTEGFGFCKARRLLKASDFKAVFDEPTARASHRHLLLLARCNDLPQHRLGLVIAKKHVRLAVNRNRIKRIAREFFRQLPASTPALDVILLARAGVGDLDNSQLSSILLQQWQRLCQTASNAHSSHSRDSI